MGEGRPSLAFSTVSELWGLKMHEKWGQCRQEILDYVCKQKMQFGMKFPSDKKLGDELGYNRHVVMKAMQALARQGVVSRAKGRATFYAMHRPTLKNISDYHRFHATVLEHDFRLPQPEPLSAWQEKTEMDIAQILGLSQHESFYVLRRVRRIEERSVARHDAYLNPRLLSRFHWSDFKPSEDHLLRLYEAQGFELIGGKIEIAARLPNEWERNEFTLEENEPVLATLQIRWAAGTNEVLEVLSASYAQGKHELHFR